MSTAYNTMQTSTALSRDKKIVDLRSDTVTRPSAGMYDAMQSAPLGDDVYGDDETVNTLEAKAAAMVGKQAGLFVSSGTQSNLIALLTHCQRGEEIIVGDRYHVNAAEARGGSVLGGIAISPLATDARGGLQVEQISGAIMPDDFHYPVPKLLSLENTVSGHIQSPEHMELLCQAGRAGGLLCHLDGARVFNAAVALDVPVAELAKPFDSISLCLSKGLGAPVGSVLCGSEAFIHRARRHRKLLGGGMRQGGILAACGLYALEYQVARLANDHANARRLAEGLSEISELSVSTQTNMVFVELTENKTAELQGWLAGQGIVISASFPSIRLVTHIDVDRQDVERVINGFAGFFKS
jgi:threonine aldolase